MSTLFDGLDYPSSELLFPEPPCPQSTTTSATNLEEEYDPTICLGDTQYIKTPLPDKSDEKINAAQMASHPYFGLPYDTPSPFATANNTPETADALLQRTKDLELSVLALTEKQRVTEDSLSSANRRVGDLICTLAKLKALPKLVESSHQKTMRKLGSILKLLQNPSQIGQIITTADGQAFLQISE